MHNEERQKLQKSMTGVVLVPGGLYYCLRVEIVADVTRGCGCWRDGVVKGKCIERSYTGRSRIDHAERRQKIITRTRRWYTSSHCSRHIITADIVRTCVSRVEEENAPSTCGTLFSLYIGFIFTVVIIYFFPKQNIYYIRASHTLTRCSIIRRGLFRCRYIYIRLYSGFTEIADAHARLSHPARSYM